MVYTKKKQNRIETLGDNIFSGDIDPDIAELMEIETEPAPDFGDLFEGEGGIKREEKEELDLTKQSFSPVKKFHEDRPIPIFSSKEYYKAVLSGEGEASQRLHSLLSKFLNAKDPKEKSMYRSKLIPAYWNVAASIASRIGSGISEPKKFMLRYGFLLPTLVSREQRESIGKIVVEKTIDEPFFYIDEWLKKVGSGQISPSAVDEIKTKKKAGGGKIRQQIEKLEGSRDLQISSIKNKLSQMEMAEEELLEKVKGLMAHSNQPGFENMKAPYSVEQRSILGDITSACKFLSTIDKQITESYSHLETTTAQLEQLREKAAESGESIVVSAKTLEEEFNTVRQMIKMCVGRQGNHIPFLMKQYFKPNIRDIGTRENIISEFAAIEALDPGLFKRTFKRETTRIVPYVIIVPAYGDRGICWEPFEKFNRATSRGRVAIPMFPKDLRTAVLAAAADLRWQVAKEKAQHYWMEEGLTGRYYQWFTERKLRGDVKEYFIQDYILWITKESEGTQKMERGSRSVFWRYIPFPQELRDRLRQRGFVYNELYKRDINRSMSDGY